MAVNITIAGVTKRYILRMFIEFSYLLRKRRACPREEWGLPEVEIVIKQVVAQVKQINPSCLLRANDVAETPRTQVTDRAARIRIH